MSDYFNRTELAMYRATLPEAQADARPATPVAVVESQPVEAKAAWKVEHELYAARGACHLKALKFHAELTDHFENAQRARRPSELRLAQAGIKAAVKDMETAIAEMEKYLPTT